MSPPSDPRPLRVFHLIKGLGRGGAERLLESTLAHADREGFVYGYGYFRPDKDALAEPLRQLGAEVHLFPAAGAGALLLQTARVGRLLSRWRADLVHAHLPLAGVVARLAGRRRRIPVVYTEHNVLGRYHPLTRRANLATWGWQRQVVAVSDEVAASVRRYKPGSPVPLTVVPNGVDTAAFTPDPAAAAALRQELGLPAGAPVVGQVAVFRAQKRLDLWLTAAAAIHRERPETRFLLVGAGPLEDEVRRQAAELGLADALVLPGLRRDVAAVLAVLDVFLLSSDWEGLPVAVLEAMAAARPVVATAVGGLPPLLGGGGAPAGVVVPPGEAAPLAAAVLRLLADDEGRRRLGEAARRRVAEGHDVGRMSRRLEEIYRQVLQPTTTLAGGAR